MATSLAEGRYTRDGAGVRLRRVFGFGSGAPFDPFLLLDEFGSDDPSDYLPGFPWHPHRGIETVTLMLSGRVRHGDSMGNGGVIGPGDAQWMRAGSGILHEEMPLESEGGLRGLQLWVNLPAREKMSDPAYQDVRADEVPSLRRGDTTVRLVAGSLDGVEGPANAVAGGPFLAVVGVPPGASLELPIPDGRSAFAYPFDGSLDVGGAIVGAGTAVGLGPGEIAVFAAAGSAVCRFLVAHAPALREPVAWRGPIVMNTQDELDRARDELAAGDFIKRRAVSPKRP